MQHQQQFPMKGMVLLVHLLQIVCHERSPSYHILGWSGYTSLLYYTPYRGVYMCATVHTCLYVCVCEGGWGWHWGPK